MTVDPLGWEIVEPNPSALIESLRSFGYSTEAAIADLVDNSITAAASRIDIRFNWDGPHSSVFIIDDGQGMAEEELSRAMRPGSSNPRDERSPDDLGRFGLGLKTASFAHCRRLTVSSKDQLGKMSVRSWDLDHVGNVGAWQLLTSHTETSREASRALEQLASGTAVTWERMDRLVDGRDVADEKATSQFYEMTHNVAAHLAMIFHRFLAGTPPSLSITVNGTRVEPWDPFLTDHKSTIALPPETLSTPNGSIQIQPYVLPHFSKLSKKLHEISAGVKGWNHHQGFYIYRANRLLVPGTWFHKDMKSEEHYKLARISVDVSQGMDEDWAIDVRKSRARPPAALREDLTRIARATRSQASEIYRRRGQRITRLSQEEHKPLWDIKHASGEVKYLINRNHPIVAVAMEGPTKHKNRVRALLDMIDRSVPIPRIVSDAYERPEEQAQLSNQQLTSDMKIVAIDLLHRALENSEDIETAINQVLAFEPFAQYPELAEILREEIV